MGTTYTELVSAIQSFAEDDDADYVAEIPAIIRRSEQRILRDFDFELFVDTDDTVTGQATRAVTLPAGMIQVEFIWHRPTTGGAWVPIFERTFERCLDYSRDETEEGGPVMWNQNSETDVYLSPTPPAPGVDLRIRAIRRPDGLTVSNENTWIGDNLEDVLLQACLIEAWQFLKNSEKADQAANLYMSLANPAKLEIERLLRKTYKEVRAIRRPNDNG